MHDQHIHQAKLIWLAQMAFAVLPSDRNRKVIWLSACKNEKNLSCEKNILRIRCFFFSQTVFDPGAARNRRAMRFHVD